MVSTTFEPDRSTSFAGSSRAPKADENSTLAWNRERDRLWNESEFQGFDLDENPRRRILSNLEPGTTPTFSAVGAYARSIEIGNRRDDILRRLAPLVRDSKDQRDRALGESIEQRFDRMADQWARETAPLSSLTEMVMHPLYQQIIGIGALALPSILRRLKAKHELWFWALRAITGETPEPPDSQGDVDQMAAAWIDWGRERGLL
jgi:hypothetical protein